MNDHELISAFMDGELEAAERARALDVLQRDPMLAETWRRWQLVRASLHHEAADASDLSAAVAERLAREPVLLAPRPHPVSLVRRPLLAVAAAAACMVLAVVVWMGRTPGQDGSDFTELYATTPQQTVISVPASDSAKPLDEAQRANAYIVMHSEYAHRGMQSGLRNFTRLAVADEVVAGESL